jgi:flagellar hook-associated protein FlgK
VITAREIDVASSKARATRKDIWLTDPGVRGRGRFTVRCTPSGARICMYRYTRADGTRDTMRVGATPNPSADNRNARAMQALGDATIVDGERVIDRYAELIGDVGARAQSAQASASMSSRLYDDAERARQEMSGVNLDEEAARLLQYQQAYQAAAKVIATANEMFRSLLQAAG